MGKFWIAYGLMNEWGVNTSMTSTTILPRLYPEERSIFFRGRRIAGLSYFGTYHVSPGMDLQTDLYVGNNRGNKNYSQDDTSRKQWGGRLLLNTSALNYNLDEIKLAYSYMTGKYPPTSSVTNTEPTEDQLSVYSLKLQSRPISFKTEYTKSEISILEAELSQIKPFISQNIQTELEGWYTQLGYDLTSRTQFVYRWDHIDFNFTNYRSSGPTITGPGGSPVIGDMYLERQLDYNEHVFTVNYDLGGMTIRPEYRYRDHEDEIDGVIDDFAEYSFQVVAPF